MDKRQRFPIPEKRTVDIGDKFVVALWQTQLPKEDESDSRWDTFVLHSPYMQLFYWWGSDDPVDMLDHIMVEIVDEGKFPQCDPLMAPYVKHFGIWTFGMEKEYPLLKSLGNRHILQSDDALTRLVKYEVEVVQNGDNPDLSWNVLSEYVGEWFPQGLLTD